MELVGGAVAQWFFGQTGLLVAVGFGQSLFESLTVSVGMIVWR